MKGKLLSILIAVLLLTIAFSGCSENKTDNTEEPKETVVIQQLIDNASMGDTIRIPSGTYHENIVIDKSITLIGENKNTTIIDGDEKGSAITINADNVKINGFTIKNGSGVPLGLAGIFFNSDYNEITNNIVSDNADGLHLNNSDYNIVKDNIFMNNIFGLVLSESHGNNVSDNYIQNPYGVGIFTGISILYSNENTFSKNIIIDNTGNGFFLYYSNNNIIIGNNISNNRWGIFLEGSITLDGNILLQGFNNSIIGNVISKNVYGITPRASSNLFYHNNLIENENQIGYMPEECQNVWNSSNKGNYWDDYKGSDINSDGLGDTPYIINGYNQDNYPSMNPFDI